MSFMACDYFSSSYSANSSFLNALYNKANVRAIGRYYDYCGGSLDEKQIGGCSANSKILTAAEVSAIHNAGIKIWSVFENGTAPSYFTNSQGQADCHQAVYMAEQAGQPANSVIYFAVDGCSQESFENNIVNYFNGVIDYMTNTYSGKYGVGAYVDSTIFSYLKNNLTNPSKLGSYWHHCQAVGSTNPGPAIHQYNGTDGDFYWCWNPSTDTITAEASLSCPSPSDYGVDIDEVYLSKDSNGYDIYW